MQLGIRDLLLYLPPLHETSGPNSRSTELTYWMRPVDIPASALVNKQPIGRYGSNTLHPVSLTVERCPLL